ncbi:hypothetical protein FQN51_000718 [Onygenales sp. PD_10]|nr:hypothetical protein FQN51_000718 [Onygenales sp. PD_10]
MSSPTTMEDTIRQKLTTTLSPTTLLIRNDSHLHAHHAPMRGSTSTETHFQYVHPFAHPNKYISNNNSITITSPSFAGKMQAARHRMVYAALKDEMAAEGGIHALQLRTRTVEEEGRGEGKGDNVDK